MNVARSRQMVAGIRRRGISAARNICCAIGTSTKKATKTLTPPYVTTAEAITTESIARCVPNRSVKKRAIDVIEPLSSMSLPNKPPSRNNGSHWATKRDAPPMNVCVQWASSGSPDIAAASIAAAGATSNTLQPRNASHINRPSASNMPRSPTVLPSITSSPASAPRLDREGFDLPARRGA